MPQKKCPICTKVKGKRGCLLNNNSLICSQCCAQIRNSNCEGCGYYKESQHFAIEKAKKYSQHFVARIAPEVDEEINQALEMINSGNLHGAEKLLNTLAKENSDLYYFHFAIGMLYCFKEKYDEAIKSFDKSIEIYPYYVDCWFNRAAVAKKKHDMVEIVVSLQKVVEIGAPFDSLVLEAKETLDTITQGFYQESGLGLDAYLESMKLFNAAFDLMKNKEWNEAIAGFEKTASINQNSAPTFGNLALCYMHLGENEQAFYFFDKAIEIDPIYEPALLNREILKKGIEQKTSLLDLPMKIIQYAKDYSLKDNKLLIDDYINDKL